jgi:3-phenylpropionate/trans-cinnamate dioxygenase ferredoxin reductase subunit
MERTPVAVVAVEEVGPDAIAVEFETPEGFTARPGQFVKLFVTVDGEAEPRFYTISSPDTVDSFEVTIGIDPEGEVTPQLRSLAAGDELPVAGPYGNAYYEDEPEVLVLAGGPGVGPAVGIAERALADGHAASVVYRDESPLHEGRLAALDGDGAEVRLLGPADPLTDAVAEFLTADTQVFVYGFADFLDDATAAIEAAGGDPDAAKMENFG